MFNSMETAVSKSSNTNIAERESKWRNHLARYASSGQTVAAFCRSEALSEGGFYFWRKRLQTQGNSSALAPPLTPAPFLDLGVVKSSEANLTMPRMGAIQKPTPTGIEVRIDLGGVVLTITRH